MPQINFGWSDLNGQGQTYQLLLSAPDIEKKTNIGRDQQQCEIWLAHNTVSRVHAEVSFKSQWQRFYIRNLATNNPIRVDGGLLSEGEVALYPGSLLQLGQIMLQVSSIVLDEPAAHSHEQPLIQNTPPFSSAPTRLSQALPPAGPSGQGTTQPPSAIQPPAAQPPVIQQNAQPQSTSPKLTCPKCQTLQALSLRNSNCPVCGHFLADASTRYML
ncbi:MAG: FHA domain-containing protein [Cyanobacteria bacterium J06598_1]